MTLKRITSFSNFRFCRNQSRAESAATEFSMLLRMMTESGSGGGVERDERRTGTSAGEGSRVEARWARRA